MEIDNLHNDVYLLCVAHAAKKIMELIAPHSPSKLESMGQPRGKVMKWLNTLICYGNCLWQVIFWKKKNKALRLEPMEELVSIRIHPMNDSKTTKVDALLQDNWRTKFMKFLKENVDVFTWSHDEMLRIEPNVMVHH